MEEKLCVSRVLDVYNFVLPPNLLSRSDFLTCFVFITINVSFYYIRIEIGWLWDKFLPDKFLLTSVVFEVDLKRNMSGRTGIYEYEPPPTINALITALLVFHNWNKLIKITTPMSCYPTHVCIFPTKLEVVVIRSNCRSWWLWTDLPPLIY